MDNIIAEFKGAEIHIILTSNTIRHVLLRYKVVCSAHDNETSCI